MPFPQTLPKDHENKEFPISLLNYRYSNRQFLLYQYFLFRDNDIGSSPINIRAVKYIKNRNLKFSDLRPFFGPLKNYVPIMVRSPNLVAEARNLQRIPNMILKFCEVSRKKVAVANNCLRDAFSSHIFVTDFRYTLHYEILSSTNNQNCLFVLRQKVMLTNN